MLNEAGVDLVAVCAPPQLHAEIGLAVVDAGKHLFMEKPLALSLHDADRLVKRAAGGGAQSPDRVQLALASAHSPGAEHHR